MAAITRYLGVTAPSESSVLRAELDSVAIALNDAETGGDFDRILPRIKDVLDKLHLQLKESISHLDERARLLCYKARYITLLSKKSDEVSPSVGSSISPSEAEIDRILTCLRSNESIVCHMDRMGSQKTVIEVAKACAAKNVWATAQFIHKFGIRNERDLIEIAKICAAKDGERTAQFIKGFGITNQPALIEIAKVCASKAGRITAQYIQDFGITDQPALIDLAKACATQIGTIIT